VNIIYKLLFCFSSECFVHASHFEVGSELAKQSTCASATNHHRVGGRVWPCMREKRTGMNREGGPGRGDRIPFLLPQPPPPWLVVAPNWSPPRRRIASRSIDRSGWPEPWPGIRTTAAFRTHRSAASDQKAIMSTLAGLVVVGGEQSRRRVGDSAGVRTN
jgi:hypothetical protein